MTDWADEKAFEILDEGISNIRSFNDDDVDFLAQALRSARAKGIEEAAVCAEDWGCGAIDNEEITPAAFDEKYGAGASENLAEAIRKLKEQP